MRTIAEKILGGETGEIVEREVDYIMVNDITGVPAFEVLDEIGTRPKVEKIVVVPDHYVPNKDVASAEQAKRLKEYVMEYGIDNYYEIGGGGICHQVMIEEGYVAPGRLIVGADSHTTSYGALGAFSTGIGSAEAAAAMATGKLWFKVPESQKFVINGKLEGYVMGKDIALHIIGDIGVSGSLYKSQEFYGSTVSEFPLADRLTIANMSVEAGAKCCIFPSDEKVFSFLRNRVKGDYTPVYADDDAGYVDTFEYDATQVAPTVAKPFLPSNTSLASEVDVQIDQAYIGSCTNGRIEDLRIAAGILKNRKVRVRTIIVPASRRVFEAMVNEGLMKIFIDADAYVSGPTCGACLGGYMGVLAKGERCISTTNRNFIGRMGHPESEVYLASPATVAASAVTGRITDPNDL